MDLERIKDTIKQQGGLSNTLDMEFISTPEPDIHIVRIRMGDSNKQVSGPLSGSATLALAEGLADVESIALCPDEIRVSINVGDNHVRSMIGGDTMMACGRLQYRGDALHQWHTEIKDQDDRLISTVQVTDLVMCKPKK